jgi:hypothetical protein
MKIILLVKVDGMRQVHIRKCKEGMKPAVLVPGGIKELI